MFQGFPVWRSLSLYQVYNNVCQFPSQVVLHHHNVFRWSVLKTFLCWFLKKKAYLRMLFNNLMFYDKHLTTLCTTYIYKIRRLNFHSQACHFISKCRVFCIRLPSKHKLLNETWGASSRQVRLGYVYRCCIIQKQINNEKKCSG